MKLTKLFLICLSLAPVISMGIENAAKIAHIRTPYHSTSEHPSG